MTVSYAREVGQILVGGNLKQIFGRSYYKSVNVAEIKIESESEYENASAIR